MPTLSMRRRFLLVVLLTLVSSNFGRSMSTSGSFSPSEAPHMPWLKPSSEPPSIPDPSPLYRGPVAGPSTSTFPRHHRHHRHLEPISFTPAPSTTPGCGQICVEPLTSTPIGSPCGCVFPMKIRLVLDVSLYGIFPLVNQLEIDIAAGTYLRQSQVVIIGASADSQNQGRTVVDINLVPLGEKFDNTSALLTYERFWEKKVPLNKTLFGNYEVMSISYPGLPSSPPFDGYAGNGPTGSAGNQQYPITADFVNKSQKMNARLIFIISFSALVVLVVCCGAVSILLRWRKVGRPSNAVGPVFTPSTNKRPGTGSVLSSSMASSTSISLVSTMPFSILSVKTFSLAELDKATNKFSLKRVLGEGGFGRVFHGILEDRTEVAVKLLTRDNQNGDREFIAEVEMLSRLHHRNLVKLIGICVEDHTRCLVYELVPNGSVESHLHELIFGDISPGGDLTWICRYVAPEYAMTGHLLVKSDVYSYGVVLLELLSGRKPVDMSQSPGQENLVTWARPLLTCREGLAQLVDPSLAGNFDFDDMAKVAAIASMCVHPEVTHRPFMGEVVQALKLIYNDNDETCGDCCSQKESSAHDSDFKGESSWWNAGRVSPHITMEYSSGPLEEIENRPFSASTFTGGGGFLPINHGNRSGPLRTVRSKPSFYRLKGSVSEHGGLLSKGVWNDGTSGFEASF
ncbi:hypothetical protein RHGRI_035912 [Rhododendron griersonianum]|uniref:Protein kinase domain-containing protein n=1 Tax=Rhododendron griersonianum TaxID=479676 RepID=A0AAV6HNY2_9ERIC|nr:hypothetical protein RHGRI_035912 [Rhododendron griersonianum]